MEQIPSAGKHIKFVKRGKTHNGCQARENMLQRPNAGTNLTGAKARENTERVLSAGKHVSARKHATLLIDRMFRIYSRSEKANAIQKVGFGGEWKCSLINPYRIEICWRDGFLHQTPVWDYFLGPAKQMLLLINGSAEKAISGNYCFEAFLNSKEIWHIKNVGQSSGHPTLLSNLLRNI